MHLERSVISLSLPVPRTQRPEILALLPARPVCADEGRTRATALRQLVCPSDCPRPAGSHRDYGQFGAKVRPRSVAVPRMLVPSAKSWARTCFSSVAIVGENGTTLSAYSVNS